MKVANSTPKASDTAIGMRNWACMLFSSSSGVSPAKVVSEVSRIGRKREPPATRIARASGIPSSR